MQAEKCSVGLALGRLAAVVAVLFPGTQAVSRDWPMWRCDPQRTASTVAALPLPLHMKWLRRYPVTTPAWPDQPRLRFDTHYEPVVVGRNLFLGSPRSDWVVALDTETGEERWRTYLDGPVRFAPTAWRDRLFVACDDGYLYCLSVRDGGVVWKIPGAPNAKRRILGNGRLISTWPVRGAPVVSRDRVYFAAGIWPFMGVFIHCVDAETGRAIWCNSGTGSEWCGQPHVGQSFTGPAPQGYLAINGNHLLVPNGRAVAACFDARNGNLRYFPIVGNRDIGEFFVATAGRFFFNRRAVFDVESGQRVGFISGTPVIKDAILHCGDSGFDLARAEVVSNTVAGNLTVALRIPKLWQLNQKDLARVWFRAGNQVFVTTTNNTLAAWGVHENGQQPRPLWNIQIPGTPAAIVPGDDKLFVVTYEGMVCCYASDIKAPPREHSTSFPVRPSRPFWRVSAAKRILKATGMKEGYCIIFGAGDRQFVEDLLDNSLFHIILLDANPTLIEEYRRHFDALGFYGTRMAAHVMTPGAWQLPRYLANLVVLSPGFFSRQESTDETFLEEILGLLRPYGGTCVPTAEADVAFLETRLSRLKSNGFRLEKTNGLHVLVRKGPLPGAGSWTHENCDVSNTLCSRDTLVRAPLGLLWFGGPSNEKILPRHGHGPIPHVVNGRIIIEGADILRAMDVYTGRLLWETELPGVGQNYNVTYHQAGAANLGGNYVSTTDTIYVVYKDRCLRLDPVTGNKRGEITLPALSGTGSQPAWGYVGIIDDILLAGADPQPLYDPDFTPAEFPLEGQKEEDTAALRSWIAGLEAWVTNVRDFHPVPRGDNLSAPAWLALNFNKMIRDPTLVSKLNVPGPRPWTNDVVAAVRSYIRQNPRVAPDDITLRELNRALLCTANPAIPRRSREKPGSKRAWTGTGSRFLVAMNRHSGKYLWHVEAGQVFLHNAICAGNGKVFCLDVYPPPLLEIYRFTERPPPRPERLLAFEAASGRLLWSREQDVFGTWLGYSPQYDVLLQARRPARDALDGRTANRLAAYRGSDGTRLWDKDVQSYGGPCILHGTRIITQGTDYKGEAWDLLSGQPVMRIHPLSGLPVRWRWQRSYGCGTALASTHLLTFRSGEAGFYDLVCDGGTANLGGFRSGCTPNLVPADGVVAAPDYTRTCTCSYANQCSVGFIHDPDVELWTYNRIHVPTQVIERIGLNLGAPGDRLATNGTLWLEWPFNGSVSPNPAVVAVPDGPRIIRHHMSVVRQGDPAWVAASGVAGLEELRVRLVPEEQEARRYTVRLHLAELENCRPGERIFSVLIQGNHTLENLDIAQLAGGPMRAIVREVRGVTVTNDVVFQFVPVRGEPLLCGIECVAEK